MTNNLIPTLQVDYTVTATTSAFTIDVTNCNLDTDLSVNDFTVVNSSDNDADISGSFEKSSTTVLTHIGAALTEGDVLNVFRTTELARVQETLQLGSGISSSILDNEIQRIYKLIAEKASTAFFASEGNTVTRSTSPPNSIGDAPNALGDEWHVYEDQGSGVLDEVTTRFFVATDVDGFYDTYGWFEVTGQDGADGTNGTAATVAVGTVTTLDAGEEATVTNVGNTTTAVFDFGIPKGDVGATGPTGPAGADGQDGATGTVSAASALVLQEQVSAPSTIADEIKVFNDTDVLQWRLESDGATYTAVALEKEQTFTAAQRVAPSSLADGANISVNASLSNVFTVTLGGNRTLDNPTNLTAGQTFLFVLTQDGTGNRTLSYGTAYKFPGGVTPTLTTTANAVDILDCYTDGTNMYCNLTEDYS